MNKVVATQDAGRCRRADPLRHHAVEGPEAERIPFIRDCDAAMC